jgi:hypothetical protein
MNMGLWNMYYGMGFRLYRFGFVQFHSGIHNWNCVDAHFDLYDV